MRVLEGVEALGWVPWGEETVAVVVGGCSDNV
jgi:hypothetical protein